MPWYLILPAVSAALYALSSIVSKRALEEGAGLMRLVLVANLGLAVAFAPFAVFAPGPPDWRGWGWPALTSVVCLSGQVFTFAAIRWGDVSVQAPMMGTKVVLVAAFTVLIGAGIVTWQTWLGAGLTAVAIFLLGFSDWSNRRQVLQTLGLALGASASFGLADVLVMKEAPAFGPGWFLTLTNAGMALGSLIVLPFIRGGLPPVPRPAWPWLAGGAGLMVVQAIGMGCTLAFWGEATAVNIVYSSRGLWGIVLVWVAGHWFGNHEREAGRTVMGRRFAGAILLMAAIVLVLV